MKKAFITLDFENWYHIPYLEKYNFDKRIYEDDFLQESLKLLKTLSDRGLYLTVFVVGEMVLSHENYIKEISDMGHEIGCHSLYHKSLKNMNIENFITETIECKKIIENATNKQVVGYRAPFFSLKDNQLNTLSEIGFIYDSSYIQTKANEYYNNMRLTGFVNREGTIHEKINSKFFEIEIPTLKILKWHIPIAGGGFFRITPFWIFKIMIRLFYKNNDYYNFYFHPYEISDTIFHELSIMNFKDRIRFNYGRRRNYKKILKMIDFFNKKEITFSTIMNHIIYL